MASRDTDMDQADRFETDEDVLERQALTSTLNSMLVYGKAAHLNLTQPRLRTLAALSARHRALLSPVLVPHLDAVDGAIDENAEVLRLIAQYGANEFEAPQDTREWEGATAFQVDQTRSTVKQMYRDWSAEAAGERAGCYGRVVSELNKLFGVGERSGVRVLVPGAGLGRLAYDIACEGYVCQANEFSYHMLIVSNFILNHTTAANQFTIHPFVHTFSHTATAVNQTRAVKVPDVCPSASPHDTSGNFSFTAGSFTEIYGRPGEQANWNVIATVFFLDTAHNVLDYIDVIHTALAEPGPDNGAYWINFGPLLYHFEEDQNTSVVGGRAADRLSVELPLDQLVAVVEQCGFEFEKLETGIKTTYAADEKAMGNWVFECVFWVARKK